jgi:hypothetical protein
MGIKKISIKPIYNAWALFENSILFISLPFIVTDEVEPTNITP